jgi:hypothetical protein
MQALCRQATEACPLSAGKDVAGQRLLYPGQRRRDVALIDSRLRDAPLT